MIPLDIDLALALATLLLMLNLRVKTHTEECGGASILRPDVEASGLKTRAGIGPRAAAIPLAAVPKMLAHHLAQHLP